MGVLTTRVELLTRNLSELIPVLPLHYEELALHKSSVPLDPQFEFYAAREATGSLMYITLRDGDKLAGYYIGFIGPELHYRSTIENKQDIFYILPEYRGQNGGEVLFKRVQEESLRRGVMRWYVNCKAHHEAFATKLFEKLGFAKSDVQFSKLLKKE